MTTTILKIIEIEKTNYQSKFRKVKIPDIYRQGKKF